MKLDILLPNSLSEIPLSKVSRVCGYERKEQR